MLGINQGGIDRGIRTTLGLALVIVAFNVDGGVGIAAAAVGMVLLLTGIAGWCPLYALFGFDTRGGRKKPTA